jgi:hypothetical protein
MSFIIDPYRFQRTNLIQNGDFSNVSGMGVTGGGWYNGVPPMWSTQSNVANAGYSVLLLEGKYYANLNTLSVTEGITTTTKFQPLYQESAALPIQTTLTATWTIRSLNGYSYTMGAAFYVGAWNPNNNFVAVYTSPFDANTRTVSLVTSNFPANTLITFAMWQAGNTAPGVTDLTIYAD